MKVSVASLKKLVREAVEECYGEGMEEQGGSWRPRSAVPPEVAQHDTAADRYDPRTVGSAARAGRMDFTTTSTGAAPAATPASTSTSGVNEVAQLRRLVRALVSEALNEQAAPAADPLASIGGMAEQYTSGGSWRPAASRTPGPSGESGIGNKPTARGAAGEGRARGLSYERGEDVMARRAASAADRAASPASRGPMTDAEWSAYISSLASGAPVPGSAARPASASGEEVLRAGRARASEAMRALAAARADKAARRREGGWGGGASPGAVPPVPAAPTAVAAAAPAASGDPLEGIPPEELRMAESKTIREMVRKAVMKALSEQKKTK